MKLAEKLAIIRPNGGWRVVYSNDGSESVEWAEGSREPTPSDLLDAEKTARAAAITRARNAALLSLTAEWDGDTWDADEATSSRIANALSMVREASELGIPTPSQIPWRTADNKDRTLSIAELTQMGAAVFLAQQIVWAKQANLKNSIASAKSSAQVEAINW